MEQEKENEQAQPSQEQSQPEKISEVPPAASDSTNNPVELTQEKKDTSKYIFLI